MRRLLRFALPLFACVLALWSSSAQACLNFSDGLQMAGRVKRERRPKGERRETLDRQGVLTGVSVSPGMAIVSKGFLPTIRGGFLIGGAVRPRVLVHADIGGLAYLGYNKGSFATDVIVTGIAAKAVLIRAGVGGSSALPSRSGELFRPGFGGLVGLGYEFDVVKSERNNGRMLLQLSVDYDARIRIDGQYAQAVGLSLRLVGLLGRRN
jgi:hypothetical protein